MLFRNFIGKSLAVGCFVGVAASASYHWQSSTRAANASTATTVTPTSSSSSNVIDQNKKPQQQQIVNTVDRADQISMSARDSVIDCIGDTPMVRLRTLNKNPLATVYVKLESVNPSGSIKDRIAKHIIETFEKSGRLQPGGVIVENSSGNTAAAVAMVAALKGYEAVLVVPAKCSDEKVAALKAFGARVVVCPPGVSSSSPHHYEAVAKRLEAEIEGAVRLDQYNNQLNVEAHYMTTGPEIWRQTGGRIDTFVCGASTGGTISGIGRYLKEASEGRVRVMVADPAKGSALLNRVQSGEFHAAPGSTQIEGIGKNYHVDCTHFDVIDDGIAVNDDDAFRTARLMAQREGILCGISSGANVHAALQLAEQATEPTIIVTVLPDSGAKYFSKLFNARFLGDNELATDQEIADMKSQYNVNELDTLIDRFNQH